MSWYPLGHGDTALMNELVFAGLGKKYGKTPAQVILRWHTQMGFVVIPGSKNAEHIKDNMDIFDFALTAQEMDALRALDRGKGIHDPDAPGVAEFLASAFDIHAND